ncbi:MAG TPA: ATP synthase F1 subunit delta [Candidatus Acidoferrales bacterium]|nr:ATP synthase F1 subunit delta [Candidatus Acidoferrales bacterium]
MTPERAYAEALAEAALATGRPEQVRRDLGDFLTTLAGSADLRNFLTSPAVPGEVKQRAVTQVVERMGASETLRNFLFLILEHRRVVLLGAIAAAFDRELNARLGILEAEISAARELPAEEKQALEDALAQRTGQRIQAKYRVEPGLIGGAVVKIGSTVYDGSVKTELARLRARMAAV